MACERFRDMIGPAIDRQLAADDEARLREHLDTCAACREEHETQLQVVTALQTPDAYAAAQPPRELWGAIASRLEHATPASRPKYWHRFLRRPIALAASLALLIGAGVFSIIVLNPAPRSVQASEIDYSVLLNNLAADVDGAVARFIQHYHGERMTPEQIATESAPMRFHIPNELPGGFRLEASYRLKFGSMTGYAGQYRRAGEPLFVFFHPPVEKTVLGVHRESHCHVAGMGGQCVEVGPWQLMHFTDPTTCHCVLSRLAHTQEVEAILAAISPDFHATTTAPAAP